MVIGSDFSHSMLPDSASDFIVVVLSFEDSPFWEGLGRLEDDGFQSRIHRPFRVWLLSIWAASGFWKSVSSKGSGIGVVQAPSIIQDGRPVMTFSMWSKMYSDHQTRYRISFDVSEVVVPTFRRWSPRDMAPLTALPDTFHDLKEIEPLVSEWMPHVHGFSDLPIDLTGCK